MSVQYPSPVSNIPVSASAIVLLIISAILTMSWLGKLAKSLFIFLFFSFLIYNYKMERGKVSRDFVTMSQMVTSQVTVMGVTWLE